MKRIQTATELPKALLGLVSSMVVACLLLLSAQIPARAQCNSCGPWVQDASYSSTDESGNMNVEVVAYPGGDSPDS
jgi:hypothetical protein